MFGNQASAFRPLKSLRSAPLGARPSGGPARSSWWLLLILWVLALGGCIRSEQLLINLLRKSATGYRLYDVNAGLMNPKYVAYMIQAGKMTVTEQLSPLLPVDTRNYTVTSKEALVEFFEDIAKLDDAALAAFADYQEVAMITRQEAHEAHTRSERIGARIDLENGRPPALPPVSTSPMQKCPGMPAGITCEEIETPALDIMPRLAASEILYFEKDDCGPCKSAETAVAQ